MRRKLALFVLLGMLALVLSGCIKDGYQTFVDECKTNYKWTQRQIEAAYDGALKEYYLIPNEDGTYTINTSAVSVEDAYLVIEEVLGDIAWVLSPDRSPKWKALLLGMPSLKAGFEREEQKWLYIKSQLAKVLVYQDFLELLGKTMKEADKAYRIEYLLPENTEFVYEPEYLQKAKEDGTLQKVEEGMYYVYTPFGYKIPDPAARDDPNAYIWQPMLQGYWVVSYAILSEEKPQELKADYAEIFRAKVVEGRIITEKYPCVRAFRQLNGDALRVIVIDWDHEGEPGYGSPDEVRRDYADTGWKVIVSNQTLFEALARPRSEVVAAERNLELPPFDLKIVRLGKVEEYKGEYNPDGWTVPYEYRDEHGIDHKVKIVQEDLPEDYPFKRIAYVVRIWADGAVYEYWTPKAEFAGDMETLYAVIRNIVFQPVGGVKQEISADRVIDKLHRIIYRYGDTWIEIVDLDGTGKLQYKIVGVAEPDLEQKQKTSSYPKNISGGF